MVRDVWTAGVDVGRSTKTEGVPSGAPLVHRTRITAFEDLDSNSAFSLESIEDSFTHVEGIVSHECQCGFLLRNGR